MDTQKAQERLAELLLAERGKPGRLWWLSFCDPDKPRGQQFLGVAIVEAPGPVHAQCSTWALGINPGGEVMTYQAGDVPVEYRHRLLSRAELKAAGLIAA